MGDDTQAMLIQCRTDGVRIDLARSGGGRFQREVHKVETVIRNPLDLTNWITGGRDS